VELHSRLTIYFFLKILCDFLVLKYPTFKFNIRILAEKIKNLLEFISVKPRYNTTSFITDTSRGVEIPSYTLCRFSVEVTVNKQWTL
jgi:hypothetical protein